MPKCSYCDAIDDIPLFMRWENVLDLWTRFFNWWNQVHHHNVNFPTRQSEDKILCGLPNNGDNNATLNFCMLHIKHYIYKQRLFPWQRDAIWCDQNILLVKLELKRISCQEKTNRKTLQNSIYWTINRIFKSRYHKLITGYKNDVWHFCLLGQMLVIHEVVGAEATITSTPCTVLPVFATRFAACTGGTWLTFMEPYLT